MKKGLFQLQYELPTGEQYTERGSDAGAKFTPDLVDDDEVRHSLETTSSMNFKEQVRWLADKGGADPVAVLPFTTHTPEALAYRLENRHPKLLYIMRPLHTIELLNEFLYAANYALDDGAIVCCHTMTSVLKRKLVEQRYPWGISTVVNGWSYMWHRVCPKLKLTRRLYFTLTEGKNRSFHRVEVLGRMYRAGFEVLDEQFRQGEFFVIARKMKEPVDDAEPTGSPIIHLRRIGYGGQEIVVHKFRTMYTYSEYIQSYIFQYQNLQSGGKFRDDYRINMWGKILRRTWLDELPMVWNMLRGEMKLVGVRPLSRQYFSLYTPEMQQLRTRTKPGLLPPFYYDRKTPDTIEEVQASERRYLEAYLEKPFATDWRYFWGIVGNILFRRKRSK